MLYKSTHSFRCDGYKCAEVFETTTHEDYELDWDVIASAMDMEGWMFEQADTCYCPLHAEAVRSEQEACAREAERDAMLDALDQAEAINRKSRIANEGMDDV